MLNRTAIPAIFEQYYNNYLKLIREYAHFNTTSMSVKYLNINTDISKVTEIDSSYDVYNINGIYWDIYEFTPLFYFSPISNNSAEITDLVGQGFDGNSSAVITTITKPQINDLILFYEPVNSGEIFRVTDFRFQTNLTHSNYDNRWFELTLEYAPIKDITSLKISNTYIYDAAEEKYYKKDVFDKVIKNLKYAGELKHKYNLDVTIGVQFVLLNENLDSIENLINVIKNYGIDYISIKPFVLQNENQLYRDNGLNINLKKLFQKLESYSTDSFKVIARVNSFENYGKRDYKHCYGCNFITTLNSAGDIGSCLPYWDKQEFVYGNIYKNSFSEIWNSQKRKEIKKFLEHNLDVSKCPPNCRANSINEFLYEIKHPNIKHINFI